VEWKKRRSLPQDRAVITPGFGAGDRRRVCRYRPALQQALLGWWQESSFTNLPVCLADLSLNGCLLELDRLPDLPAQQAVWVHLHKETQLDWVEGRIISVRKPLLRKCKIRVLFVAPLAYESFKRVIYGPEYLRGHSPTSKPEHEWDQFWK
jgi:hypothetical protein